MSEVLSGIGFSFAKWDTTAWTCTLVLWLALLACALTSIRTQPFGTVQRRCWMLVVIALPIVGLLVYLPFSMKRGSPTLRGWIRENRALRNRRAENPNS